MIQAERLKDISSIVQREGKITIDEICTRFSVSEMTARRDLQELARTGLVRRVHGGAISTFGRSYEPPYEARAQDHIEAKRAIGIKAAELVSDGDSIALDIGTTTLEIARALKDRHNLTVVTSSLPIAYEMLADYQLGTSIRLILTGGIVRPGEHSMVGHIAEQTFGEIHVDKAFISASGIDLEAGLTEYNLEDSLVKRSLIRTARQILVVADSSKFGITALASMCPLSSVDTIITDSGIQKTCLQALRQAGVRVVIAEQSMMPRNTQPSRLRKPSSNALFIDPALIYLGFGLQDSCQVIFKLAGMLAEYGAVKPEYGQAAWEREQKYPTGLPTEGIYVALPHADPDSVIFDALAMAICSPPVMFRNMADPDQMLPVEIAIMAVVADGKRQVKLLQQLANILGEPENLRALRDSKTEFEAAAVLCQLLEIPGE